MCLSTPAVQDEDLAICKGVPQSRFLIEIGRAGRERTFEPFAERRFVRDEEESGGEEFWESLQFPEQAFAARARYVDHGGVAVRCNG